MWASASPSPSSASIRCRCRSRGRREVQQLHPAPKQRQQLPESRVWTPQLYVFLLLITFFFIPLVNHNSDHPHTGVSACPATSTTTTPVTTTTTTTTTQNPCTLCSLNTITLTPGNGVTTATPTTPGPQLGPNGCSILVVTCTAPAGGTDFMQFNFNQGGPLQPIGNPIIATLNCVNGQWVYEPGNGLPNRQVNEVNCRIQTVG